VICAGGVGCALPTGGVVNFFIDDDAEGSGGVPRADLSGVTLPGFKSGDIASDAGAGCEKESIPGLCVGRSYCDSGNNRWNLKLTGCGVAISHPGHAGKARRRVRHRTSRRGHRTACSLPSR
jgi:hypothetical protein